LEQNKKKIKNIFIDFIYSFFFFAVGAAAIIVREYLSKIWLKADWPYRVSTLDLQPNYLPLDYTAT